MPKVKIEGLRGRGADAYLLVTDPEIASVAGIPHAQRLLLPPHLVRKGIALYRKTEGYCMGMPDDTVETQRNQHLQELLDKNRKIVQLQENLNAESTRVNSLERTIRNLHTVIEQWESMGFFGRVAYLLFGRGPFAPRRDR